MATFFQNIQIKHLRGIIDLEIDGFKQFNFIIGNNDVGKTTVLEALYLTINPNNPTLPLNINGIRGMSFIDNQYWKSLFHNYEIKNNISITAQLFNNYTLRVLPKPIVEVKELEELSQKGVTSITPGTTLEQSIQGLRIEFEYSNPEGKQSKFKSEIKFMVQNSRSPVPTINPTINQDNKWHELITGHLLATQNTYNNDLAPRISQISTNKMEHELVEIIREIEPNINNIDLDFVSRVIVDYEGLPTKILLNSLGEGVYRTLNILSLIYVSANGVVLLDELETGLDRNSQKILLKGILRAAKKYNVQIFMTTHSLEMIDNFNQIVNSEKLQEEIFLLRLEKDEARQIKGVGFDFDQLQYSRDQGWEIR